MLSMRSEKNNSQQRDEPCIAWSGVLLVFLAPALGGFLYGYDIGATSFVLTMLLNDKSSWAATNNSNWQQGLMVAAVSLGALAGSHIVLFHLANFVGRRLELRIAAALYAFGTALNVLSGTILGGGLFGWMTLVLGRLVFGVGVGFVMRTY